MKLAIDARDVELATADRAQLENRVRMSIGLRDREIEVVRVTLRAPDPRRGGVRCRVALRCDDGDRVSLEEEAADTTGAIDLALWRLERQLRRLRLR